jgi:hypothetical protein
MKDKLDEHGKRLPWDAEGKYVTLLSDKDILRCDSVPSDTQTCALRSYYEDGGSRFVRNVAIRMMMLKAGSILGHVRTCLSDYSATHLTELIFVVTVYKT